MSEPLRFGILTVSDRSSRGERPDLSGPVLQNVVVGQGWVVVKYDIVADEKEAIGEILRTWADAGDLDVVLTTGGTGFANRDVTPEATLGVIDRSAPGLAEAMRAMSLKITPFAMLSRGISGIRRRTLILNLPGSPKGAREHLEVVIHVLHHAVQLLRDDPESESGHRPEKSTN